MHAQYRAMRKPTCRGGVVLHQPFKFKQPNNNSTPPPAHRSTDLQARAAPSNSIGSHQRPPGTGTTNQPAQSSQPPPVLPVPDAWDQAVGPSPVQAHVALRLLRASRGHSARVLALPSHVTMADAQVQQLQVLHSQQR